jgi:hypothetical protein
MVSLRDFLKVASSAGFRLAMAKKRPRELMEGIQSFLAKTDPSKKIFVSTPSAGDSVRSARKMWAKTMQTRSQQENQALSSMLAALKSKGLAPGGVLSTKIRNLPG